MGRSFNSEVVARLTASLADPAPPSYPPLVQDAIDHEVAQRGGTPEEALIRLVLAGQTKGGTVVKISVAPGTTLEQVRAMVEAASTLVPADATVTLQQG